MAVLAAIDFVAGLLSHPIDSNGAERDHTSLHPSVAEDASGLLPRRDFFQHGRHQRELERLRFNGRFAV